LSRRCFSTSSIRTPSRPARPRSFSSSATFTPKPPTLSLPPFPPSPCTASSLPRRALSLDPPILAPRSPPTPQEPTFSTPTDSFEHDGRLARSRPRQLEFADCSEPAKDAVPRERVDFTNPLSPLTFNPSESALTCPSPVPSSIYSQLSFLDPRSLLDVSPLAGPLRGRLQCDAGAAAQSPLLGVTSPHLNTFCKC
jgi:hypothetical protein